MENFIFCAVVDIYNEWISTHYQAYVTRSMKFQNSDIKGKDFGDGAWQRAGMNI